MEGIKRMKHLDIVWTSQFKKDYKLAMKRHLEIDLLDDIIRMLANGEQLPDSFVVLILHKNNRQLQSFL